MTSKYINLEYLYELSGGDESFIKDMINSFIQQTPANLQELSSLCHEQKWNELGRMAHKTKSSLSFIGVQQMADEVGIIEQICLQSDEEVDKGYIEQLLVSIEQVFEFTKIELKEKLDTM